MLVNGAVIAEDGVNTGARPGTVLRTFSRGGAESAGRRELGRRERHRERGAAAERGVHADLTAHRRDELADDREAAGRSRSRRRGWWRAT